MRNKNFLFFMAALAAFILVATLNALPAPKTSVNTYSGSTMSNENTMKPTLEKFTLDKESLIKFKIAAVTGNTDQSVEFINEDTGEHQLNLSGKNLTFATFKKLQPGNYTFQIKSSKKASQKIAYSYKLQLLTPRIKTQSKSSANLEYGDYQTSGLKYNQIIVVNKNSDSGFNWPYLLYIPEKIKKDKAAKILVLPNNTLKPSDNFEDHFNKALADFNFLKPHFDDHIILMPVFPRFRDKMGGDLIYTHALDRDAITISPLDKTDIYRLDLQLVKMIEHAQVILQAEENIDINKQVDMFGFSASASFTDRFVFLHPDLVDKIAIGGFNGILTLPADKLGEYQLAYPLGIDDYNEITGYAFDLKKVSSIHRFVFMGSEDTNDAALYRDAYSTEEETKIMNLMGKTPIERIPFLKKIYREYGYNNTVFKTYQGVGHTITGEMISDIQGFFKETG